MLYSLMDGHARTSTELAVVAGVSPSTASVHLNRLTAERLVNVLVQGKHRYYSLDGPAVASVLEGLKRPRRRRSRQVRAAYAEPFYGPRERVTTTWPARLAVALHDRLPRNGMAVGANSNYELTAGTVRVASSRHRRRRPRERCGAVSPTHAWIGASGGRTSAARWAPRLS